jgi:methylphosphotriester-DNA--protein-cysteine methyltransferase
MFTAFAHASLPDLRVCEQARLSRDARFDGLFFIAVTTTRIYCRPVCPAPQPKPTNVTYYPNAAAAEAAGFRPCLRCRPELSPSDGAWRRGDAAVARALKLIDEGALAEQSRRRRRVARPAGHEEAGSESRAKREPFTPITSAVTIHRGSSACVFPTERSCMIRRVRSAHKSSTAAHPRATSSRPGTTQCPRRRVSCRQR